MSQVGHSLWFVDAVAHWQDRELEARLRGLLAVLALPEVRLPNGSARRRVVEVEIADGLWRPITGFAIECDQYVAFATDGVRHEYRFHVREGCPRWRLDHGVERIEVFA